MSGAMSTLPGWVLLSAHGGEVVLKASSVEIIRGRDAGCTHLWTTGDGPPIVVEIDRTSVILMLAEALERERVAIAEKLNGLHVFTTRV